ncbi:hypothetical protein KFL_001910140 [Klebsormidium nitens]|uniref:Glycosyl transferase CAP10 domain-containing protein n=1 Tax=Klebsormidium nitens TaxID=105231 RepID=A0A1Y1I0Q4_KLENI|nr:hypothetical protein KFL_001910140 [Klebsormidium nitens]|eukprot:GAQ84495.1 hypothetical protein KFL_001910140 [Klebsormidium nitens]
MDISESAKSAGAIGLKAAVDLCIRRPLLILGLVCVGLINVLVGTSWEDVAFVQQRAFLVAAAVRIRTTFQPHEQECPAWFSGMYEDLAPWKEKGSISAQDIEAALPGAAIHFTIIGGKLYAKEIKPCFPNRARYSTWGLLQLLRYFPGQVPDVDFVFECNDYPQMVRPKNPADPTPVLLNYDNREGKIDVPFPDWTFWGWPDLEIARWRDQSHRIDRAARAGLKWIDREKTAFWKGAAWLNEARKALVRCTAEDPSFLLSAYDKSWGNVAAHETNFTDARLEDQCGYRYRIYAEGSAWSVSIKYGLACGSTMLLVEPVFKAFYDHGLRDGENCLVVPKHPALCENMRDKVRWGNDNPELAGGIGEAGAKFALEDLDMHNVYSYMLHLLKAYASLQDFVPGLHPDLKIVTEASIRVESSDFEKRDYLLSEYPASRPPCIMPPGGETEEL